jgi:hypothetical protein
MPSRNFCLSAKQQAIINLSPDVILSAAKDDRRAGLFHGKLSVCTKGLQDKSILEIIEALSHSDGTAILCEILFWLDGIEYVACIS